MRAPILWACLGVAVWVAGAAALGGKPGPVPDPLPDPPAHGPASGADSLQLIREAVERGELDPDDAVLYRVLAVVDQDKLPPPFRSTVPIRDGTPVLRDARSRYDGLRPEVREALNPYLFPRGKP